MISSPILNKERIQRQALQPRVLGWGDTGTHDQRATSSPRAPPASLAAPLVIRAARVAATDGGLSAFPECISRGNVTLRC